MYTTGEYANAALRFSEASFVADLIVTDADYVRHTLVPGNELTISAVIRNDSPVTVDGVHISVANAGTVVHEEDIAVRFNSGKEDILYVNYMLPETIDFNSLTVTATPMMDNDADESDNSAVCALYLTDLSVENITAVCADGVTEVLTQVVNRGQTATAAATLTFRKGTPDGEVIGVEAAPAMQPGDVENIVVSLNGLVAGDMVYVVAEQLTNENLIGNNSSQAVVLESMTAELSLSGDASYSNGYFTINVNVSNNTSTPVDKINLITVAYDMNGKLLGLKSFSDISIAALNSMGRSAIIAVGSVSESVAWKAFLLDENWRPLVESAYGMISP